MKLYKVNRKRKRAIAKQAAKTRSRTFEVGDTAKIVGSHYMSGFDNGTIVTVTRIENYGFWTDVQVKVYLPHIAHWSSRIHRIEDLKKTKKEMKY